ncbi:peptidase [Ahniella affigens]|uniref:Peptidase n=1 Tax=Ahniella affigens TaxID=2021234 RepID=A0A2P1PTM0_9GAMM|nr:M48 family metallopeptidase [Ahniella affigens]AVP98189.1 peptidase [Ahniella affigens]
MAALLRLLLSFVLLFVMAWVHAQDSTAAANPASAAAVSRDFPPGLQIPDAAKPGPAFAVDRATAAYLDLQSSEQKAKSDAYFEGGYWVDFFSLLWGLAVAAFLLFSGLSRTMRELAAKWFKRPTLAAIAYAVLWLVVMNLINLPWDSYFGFMREHAYGLATQNYGDWLGDRLKGLLIGLLLGAPLIGVLYLGVRRLGANWWKATAVVSFGLALLLNMIAPVFISPLFNDYKPLPEGEMKEAIFSLARANRIPTDNVVWFDASKQTTRISANVSGFANTTQVSLNDNLINKTSLPEIKAVMGHEMGHYVLNHGLRLTVYFTLILAIGFYVVHRLMDWSLARFGARFGITDRADPAGLPLALAILSLFMYAASPLLNSVVRQAEAEADMYGLNAAREPHGFAMAAMRLSTYRKIHPGPWEEVIFYDHPSGYDRVLRSMQWLAENQDLVAKDLRDRAATPSTAPSVDSEHDDSGQIGDTSPDAASPDTIPTEADGAAN